MGGIGVSGNSEGGNGHDGLDGKDGLDCGGGRDGEVAFLRAVASPRAHALPRDQFHEEIKRFLEMYTYIIYIIYNALKATARDALLGGVVGPSTESEKKHENIKI